jgi:hypothetical protein
VVAGNETVSRDVFDVMDDDELPDVELPEVDFSEDEEAALLVALLRWRGPDLRREPA